MATYIEIADPLDALTDDECKALGLWLSAAQSRRLPPVGLSENDLNDPRNPYRFEGLSVRARLRGYRAYEKLVRARGLAVPPVPPLRAWCVWHLLQAGWKYERIIAEGSPALRRPAPDVRAPLNARTVGGRHQEALRLVKRVRAFRAGCERAGHGWFFELMARLTNDGADGV